jgi:hypothetical protein
MDWEYLANRMEEGTSLEDKRIRQFMVDDAFRHENVKLSSPLLMSIVLSSLPLDSNK